MVPRGPAADEVRVGDQHARRVRVVGTRRPACPTAPAASRRRQPAQRIRMRSKPPSRAPRADAAVDDEVVRTLGHLGSRLFISIRRARRRAPVASSSTRSSFAAWPMSAAAPVFSTSNGLPGGSPGLRPPAIRPARRANAWPRRPVVAASLPASSVPRISTSIGRSVEARRERLVLADQRLALARDRPAAPRRRRRIRDAESVRLAGAPRASAARRGLDQFERARQLRRSISVGRRWHSRWPLGQQRGRSTSCTAGSRPASGSSPTRLKDAEGSRGWPRVPVDRPTLTKSWKRTNGTFWERPGASHATPSNRFGARSAAARA